MTLLAIVESLDGSLMELALLGAVLFGAMLVFERRWAR